jgi:hypothetical protein
MSKKRIESIGCLATDNMQASLSCLPTCRCCSWPSPSGSACSAATHVIVSYCAHIIIYTSALAVLTCKCCSWPSPSGNACSAPQLLEVSQCAHILVYTSARAVAHLQMLQLPWALRQRVQCTAASNRELLCTYNHTQICACSPHLQVLQLAQPCVQCVQCSYSNNSNSCTHILA